MKENVFIETKLFAALRRCSVPSAGRGRKGEEGDVVLRLHPSPALSCSLSYCVLFLLLCPDCNPKLMN